MLARTYRRRWCGSARPVVWADDDDPCRLSRRPDRSCERERRRDQGRGATAARARSGTASGGPADSGRDHRAAAAGQPSGIVASDLPGARQRRNVSGLRHRPPQPQGHEQCAHPLVRCRGQGAAPPPRTGPCAVRQDGHGVRRTGRRRHVHLRHERPRAVGRVLRPVDRRAAGAPDEAQPARSPHRRPSPGGGVGTDRPARLPARAHRR